jgi:3-oxoacyl-[acyl-carrier protein] reductase
VRIALIIGGASGIGAASAIQLAGDGCAVAVADLESDVAAAGLSRLPGRGHRAYVADVSQAPAVASLFDRVEQDMGPVAILVVAAATPGLVDGKRPSLRETSVENWDGVMAVNVRGPFLCIQQMFRRRERTPVKNARIILLASMAAQGFAPNSPPAYVASKGAVLALTRVAAAEGERLGVTVNAIAPGAIDTPMLRSAMPVERDAAYFGGSIARRAGSPEEVACVVRFVASAETSYITGTCIDVNGGLAMR